MKLEVKMCHSHLMVMLMNPATFQRAIHSYSATTPDVEHEGMAGYIETVVTFQIKDLETFTSLYRESSKISGEWYNAVKNGMICK